MLFELRRDVESAVDVVNQVELVRRQIANLIQVVQDEAITEAGEALEERLVDIEGSLVELRLTGRGQEMTRWGSKLLGKMTYLANGLASADFQPTDQQLEVQQELEERLRALQARLDEVLSGGLAGFNQLLRSRNVPSIVMGARSSMNE